MLNKEEFIYLCYRFLYRSRRGEIPQQYIAKFLPKYPIIVEAGAHVGWDTISLGKLFKNGRIYAFEPIPDLYLKLLENTKRYQNIFCSELALGEKKEKANIYVSEGVSDASSSLLSPKDHLKIHPEVLFKKQIQINVVNLDSWLKKEKINQVDFLWLDLQGYEFQVLRSSPKTLKKVSVIYTEVSLVENYENTLLYPQFKKWLEKKGFAVKREEITWSDAGNVLFVKRNKM